MTITKYISTCFQRIQDKVTTIISTIGLKRQERKANKLQKQINKRIKSFNFTIKPNEHIDTLVVLDGRIIRIQFSMDGFLIRDDITNEGIDDQLLILKVLARLK